MSSQTLPPGARPIEIHDHVTVKCPCGKRVTFGFEGSERIPCALHELPLCSPYRVLEVDEYIFHVRKGMEEPLYIVGRIASSSPRAADWAQALGTNEVALESAFPVPGLKPGGGFAMFYKGAVSALTPEQRNNLVKLLSRRFDVPPSEVEADLDNPAQGLPILADDVTVIGYRVRAQA